MLHWSVCLPKQCMKKGCMFCIYTHTTMCHFTKSLAFALIKKESLSYTPVNCSRIILYLVKGSLRCFLCLLFNAKRKSTFNALRQYWEIFQWQLANKCVLRSVCTIGSFMRQLTATLANALSVSRTSYVMPCFFFRYAADPHLVK